MEYINCNFNKDVHGAKMHVRIEAQEIAQRDSFLYPGSIISKDMEIEEDQYRDKRRMVNVERFILK